MFPRPFHTFVHKGVPILFNIDKVKARQLDPSKISMLDDISSFEPDGDICALMRRATEAAAGVSAFLDEDDRAYLAQEGLISRRPKLCPLDFPSSVDRS